MERKIISRVNYASDNGHISIGISQTVPRLSLSVSELVKRFTLRTLEDMEQRSLLTYDFGPEVTEDPFQLLEHLDLSTSSCIDITDVVELRRLAELQISSYKANAEKQFAANKEAADRKEGEAKEAVIQEAMARLKAEKVQID